LSAVALVIVRAYPERRVGSQNGQAI